MNRPILFHLKNILVILSGSFLYSLGINYFAIANHLAEGGFTGISILLHYLFGWSTGLVLLILNIPLFLIGFRILGQRTFFYTIIGVGAVTLFLDLTKSWQHPMPDHLLAGLFTGVLIGIGLGIIFRIGGTTGGADIIARILNQYLGISIGQFLFLFDLCILAATAFIVGLNTAMYTLVAVYVSAKIVDFVVEGINLSKAVTIISEQANQIAHSITTKMMRGVTIMHGKGAFTGNKKNILYVVIAPNELPRLKQLVLKSDPHAFIVVHDARDVLGEGFSYENQNEA